MGHREVPLSPFTKNPCQSILPKRQYSIPLSCSLSPFDSLTGSWIRIFIWGFQLGAYINGKWVDVEDLPTGYGQSPDWWDDEGFGETYEEYLEHTD